MTRFDADAPAERQKLFAEAVLAHRERASAFLTVEAERPVDAGDSEPVEGRAGEGDASGSDADGGADDADADGQPPPWIQFADGVLNLDCTDEELDRLKDLLSEFPAFKVAELNRPEEAEGVNARVSAKADARRIGQFVDEAFRSVYDLPEDYRAWVVEV